MKDYDEEFTKENWSAETKRDATSHLNAICDFGFIVGLVSMYKLLHPLHGTTQKLQGRAVDIVKAFHEIEEVKADLQATRNTIDMTFKKIFDQSVRLSQHVCGTYLAQNCKEANNACEHPSRQSRSVLSSDNCNSSARWDLNGTAGEVQ